MRDFVGYGKPGEPRTGWRWWRWLAVLRGLWVGVQVLYYKWRGGGTIKMGRGLYIFPWHRSPVGEMSNLSINGAAGEDP